MQGIHITCIPERLMLLVKDLELRPVVGNYLRGRVSVSGGIINKNQ